MDCTIRVAKTKAHLCFRICKKPVFSRCDSNSFLFIHKVTVLAIELRLLTAMNLLSI